MSEGKDKVAWVFPGQGSQKVGMAQALAAADPATAQFLRQVDDALGYDLSEVIARGPDDALQQTPNQQPAVVAVSVAYLWALDEQRLLPQPDFVAGHSLGEYSALVAAGALGALDAVRLVRRRGELMQAHGAGAMAAVLGMPPAAVAEVAAEAGAEVANFNAPDQTTVSGTEAAVERAMALAKERGAKRAVRLPVSGAFHSSLMAPVVEGMRGPLAATTIRPATVPLVTEAFDWEHGVFLGSIMASETTAASTGEVGKLRFDPMAMLPFCGYNYADYFAHWLSIGKATTPDKLPRIFFVNWFRRDDQGRFLWPGYGENSRVLKWVFERTDGDVDAVDTPIGKLPTVDALDLTGLDVSDSDMQTLLSVDAEGWKAAIPQIREFYATFGEKLPANLHIAVDNLEAKLR